MKRTVVNLPDELAERAAREARRRHTSLSTLVREALLAHLRAFRRSPRRLPFAALGASGYRHTARDFEDVLDAEWAAPRRR